MIPDLANKPNFARKPLLAAIGVAFVAAFIGFGLADASRLPGQSVRASGEPLPSFEVASIKRSPFLENSSTHIQPNRFTVRNEPLEFVIKIAYGHDLGQFGFKSLRDNQLVGGPSWIHPGGFGYEGYDIDAKVEDSLAEKFAKLECGSFFSGACRYREQMILMLQSLLADRFKLKVRRETKQVPVYALVVVKGGPKFLHAKFDTADDPAHRQNPALPRPPRAPCPAGMMCWQNYGSMGQVADILSRLPQLGRPVLDQTGLEGGYYLKLQFASEQPLAATAGTDSAPLPGPTGPSIFTALQQQLGLKLKPTKGPVESIVIEHVERPTEN
jgi:uncharacterized protein (TIGR03435 family)